MGEHLEHDGHGRRVGRPGQVALGPAQVLQQGGAGLVVPVGVGERRQPRFGRRSHGFLSGHGLPQLRRGRTQPRLQDLVRLGQLTLGDVEAPRRQGRSELYEHGSEVDLDGERVVRAGAGHDRDDGDAEEISGAEPVEEGLEEAGVAGLVGGRGHDDQRAGADPSDRLLHGLRGPVEQLRAQLGQVDRQPVGAVEPCGVGGRGGDRLRQGECPRLRFGVPDDEADGAHDGSGRRGDGRTAISRAGR